MAVRKTIFKLEGGYSPESLDLSYARLTEAARDGASSMGTPLAFLAVHMADQIDFMKIQSIRAENHSRSAADRRTLSIQGTSMISAS
jgi:hypothetical protein